jgi:hypothetical protein
MTMAGTITGTLERIQTQMGRPQMVEIVLTCTADAAAATYPATVVNTLENVSDYDLRGLKLYSVKAIPGDTPPKDGTDLTITDEYGVDLLGGKGENLIDATSKTWCPAGPSNYALPALITGNFTVNITNNDVISAVTTIVLELTGD